MSSNNNNAANNQNSSQDDKSHSISGVAEVVPTFQEQPDGSFKRLEPKFRTNHAWRGGPALPSWKKTHGVKKGFGPSSAYIDDMAKEARISPYKSSFNNRGGGGGSGGGKRTQFQLRKPPTLSRQSTQRLDEDDEAYFDRLEQEYQSQFSNESDEDQYETDEDGDFVWDEKLKQFVQCRDENEITDIYIDEYFDKTAEDICKQYGELSGQQSSNSKQTVPDGSKVVPNNVPTMPNKERPVSSQPTDTGSAQNNNTISLLRDSTGVTPGRESTPSLVLSVSGSDKREESPLFQQNSGVSHGQLSSQHQQSRQRSWGSSVHSQDGQANLGMGSTSQTNAPTNTADARKAPSTKRRAWGGQ